MAKSPRRTSRSSARAAKKKEEPVFPGLVLQPASPDSPGAVLKLTAWIDESGRLVSFAFEPLNGEHAEGAALAAYNLAVRSEAAKSEMPEGLG